MKKLFPLNRVARRLRCTAIAATGILALWASAALGQNKFPVGTWDCVMSGAREGVAYITFTNEPDSTSNFTFVCLEILVPKKTKSSSDQLVSARNLGDNTRTGVDTSDTFVPGEQIFGSQFVGGTWNYDPKGRVIGNFFENTPPTSTTNVVTLNTNTFASGSFFPSPLTNGPDSNQVFCVTTSLLTNNIFSFTNQQVCYSNAITFQALTNTISFIGKGTVGKRLTLHTSTPFGGVTFRGVPPKALEDISGAWQGVKKQGFVNSQEFFRLTARTNALFPNEYDLAGAGAGYSYTNSGRALLSSQGKIGFVFAYDPIPVNPDQLVVRSVTGPFNYKKVKANTHGWDGHFLTNYVSFKAYRSGP